MRAWQILALIVILWSSQGNAQPSPAPFEEKVYCASFDPTSPPPVEQPSDHYHNQAGQNAGNILTIRGELVSSKPFKTMMCRVKTDSTPLSACVGYDRCSGWFCCSDMMDSSQYYKPDDQTYHLGFLFHITSSDLVYYDIYGYH